ncbi:MAG TPA: radical SAM protein [Polyangiaceae bacterium]
MDLRARLFDLVAPWRSGDEPIPGVRLEDASIELGLRLSFRTERGRLWVDFVPVADAQRWASRTERFALGYRTEGGRNPVDATLGMALCEAIALRCRENEARVFRALEAEREEQTLAARVRPLDVERLLERAGSGDENFYTLSPYVGCLIGCRFCYAQSKVGPLRTLLGLPPAPWGSYVDVRRNAPAVLARELADPARELLPIKFCPVVSDPYHSLERRARLTRGCIDAIARSERRWPAVILTRSALILEDRERIAALGRAWVGVSLPTVDDEARRHFEPRAASVEERLSVLQAFRSAGVPTFAVVQPLLSGSLDAHADALANSADSVSIDVLRGAEGAERDFEDPRYRVTLSDAWQRERAEGLRELLSARGVPLWQGELPPGASVEAASRSGA